MTTSITFVEYTTDLPKADVERANGRILRNAADAAMAEWLADSPELLAELSTAYESTDDAFEFVEAAADAAYAEYGLEEDQSGLSAAAAEYVYLNVSHEKAHRPLPIRNGIVLADEHVRAYKAECRRVALSKNIARRTKARRYHDIYEITHGKNGTLLGASRVALAHRKAKAEDFKAVTNGLKVSQITKVRRYMAKHGVDAVAALSALGF